MMTSPLILSVGMPRAGSGWHYNLIHDLVIATGGQNARTVRNKFFLQPVLTEVNCNIGAFTAKRLLPVLLPTFLGQKYVIKAHAGPSAMALNLIKKKRILAAYIYRDPRDALLSAYEYGQRKRQKGRLGAFSNLLTLDDAIDFMVAYIQISEAWLDCPDVLVTRYEDLLTDYDTEVDRILTFFSLNAQKDALLPIIDQYRPEKGHKEQKGTHFVRGKIGRYAQVFSANQKERSLELFGSYLEKMGYPIP